MSLDSFKASGDMLDLMADVVGGVAQAVAGARRGPFAFSL